MTPAYGFPCNADKTPRLKEWQRKLFQWQPWTFAELVGAQTGSANGFDILDVDTYKAAGAAWYDANKNKLPITRVHETRQGGKHFFFRHALGLRGSESRIAKGVDVRADGNFVIWWPRESLAVDPEGPIAEWPDWLLEEARTAQRPVRYPRQKQALHDEVVQLGKSDTELVLIALRKMNPVDWRGDFKGWFALAGACKAVGMAREDFVAWSIGDEEYVERREEIERIWECVQGAHGGALWQALSERGIRLTTKMFLSEVPYPASGISQPTRNWRARIDSILRVLERDQIERMLFSVACVVAEVIAEVGKPKPAVGRQLLEGACPKLIKEIGIDEVRRTIADAYRHVEEKFLGERE